MTERNCKTDFLFYKKFDLHALTSFFWHSICRDDLAEWVKYLEFLFVCCQDTILNLREMQDPEKRIEK